MAHRIRGGPPDAVGILRPGDKQCVDFEAAQDHVEFRLEERAETEFAQDGFVRQRRELVDDLGALGAGDTDACSLGKQRRAPISTSLPSRRCWRITWITRQPSARARLSSSRMVGTVACAPFTHSGASGRTKSFCMSMMTRAMFMVVPWLLVDLQSHFCGFLEKKHIGTGKAFLFTIGCETGTALLLYLFVKKTSSFFY